MLTLGHGLFVTFVLIIIVAMLTKTNVVTLCLIGTFVIGFYHHDFSIINGIQTIFMSSWVASIELLDLILLIAMMSTLITSLQEAGVDRVLITPFRFLLVSPAISFWVIGISMYMASVIFWPTPATALVGVVLVPAALKSGLSPMGAAVSINLAGHGMALSGDPIIQGAPGFTERAMGLPTGTVVPEAVTLSVLIGLFSMLFSFVMYKREFFNWGVVSPDIKTLNSDKNHNIIDSKMTIKHNNFTLKQKWISSILVISLLGLLVYIFNINLSGEETTALLGGVALITTIFINIIYHHKNFLEKTAVFLNQGFVFAIKIFGKIIPITGFFFLGSHHSSRILSKDAPLMLFDLAEKFTEVIPLTPTLMYIGNLILGLISGLDGSGFSGIAITANFAYSMHELTDISLVSLAVVGQMGAIWAGGGTLVSWAFGLVVTAGVTGVDPIDLARKNTIPVLMALLITTFLVAI